MRRSKLLVSSPALLTVGLVALMAASACKGTLGGPGPTNLNPVIRYQNAVYIGCDQGDTPANAIFAHDCDPQVPNLDGRLGAVVFTVSEDIHFRTDRPPLAERASYGVDAGTPILAIKDDAAGRLVARKGNGYTVFTRHPASDAKTLEALLGLDLAWRTSVPIDRQRITAITVEDTATGKQALIDDRAQLDSTLSTALSAAIDWQAQPTGRVFEITVSDGGQKHWLWYYPDADLLKETPTLDTSWRSTVPFFFRMPADFRAKLDDLMKKASPAPSSSPSGT